MTKTSKTIKKIFSVIICIALLMSYLPMLSASAAVPTQSYYSKIVDANTMDGWKNYFPISGEISTANAGGVWTDKSVFSDASAFDNITMIDDEKNFLTALSAIAANKEVVGYSTVPTDTVFILDLSNSMSSTARTNLINATNEAIASLQSTNNNNRVGVVLYSGEDRSYSDAVAALMPIDRYTTTMTSGGKDIYIEYENGEVALADDRYGTVQVRGSKGAVQSESKDYGGATYIQAGLWGAYKMFDAVADDDIYIGNNNWQAGDYRMPIVVLMTDGAPTFGTSYFADVEDSRYTTSSFFGGTQTVYGADVGDGSSSGITAGQGFLVQLTASYIKNRIENKYKVHSEKGAGRSLFYTLGFNIDPDNNPNTVTSGDVAHSVVNPDASTITDSLWNTYKGEGNTMQVIVEGRNGGNTSVTITKNSYATSKSYSDGYFSASGTGLSDAFDDIVEEIILQSRYYPTHLEGGSPDFSGYITFTDDLGEYMEVKHINGILLGDTLFDGHMMASKLANTTDTGLGTPEAPTALGNEFIWSVQARLGIGDVESARALVAAAYNAEQLCYKIENGIPVKWSNYIGWYADAAGKYVGHWNEDPAAVAPANAVYKVKSYGFLGETTGSIKNSDMMYMSVQVKQNIATGKQTVTWKIPAALVPMITYKVSLTGTNIDIATDVNVAVEDTAVTPIRLIYETGLRSDLNEFNITRITGAEHIAADGHTRIFWNNFFDISAPTHDEHITAMSEFTPNKENERFYFTFDSAVHKKDGNGYAIVGQNEAPDPNGEYYHRRYIFTTASDEPIFLYEKMSKASIEAALQNGWKDSFESLEHQTVGAWVVPKGTPARELQMYDQQKTANPTNSANMVFHPYISEHNNTVYVDMNLGNNGLLSVTPATGIKISKTVDIFEDGTSDTFKFRLTLSENGSYNTWITDLDKTPNGDADVINITNGVYEFTMRRDQTFWITGVSAGAAYSVEEISDNDDYKIKSVHVNGIATGNIANGTVSQYLIDDVDFVNTAVGEGDLVITKQVEDANGNIVNVNDSVEFTAEVTLSEADGTPVSGTFEATGGTITVPANGKFTITLSDGESFVVRGIPEETRYTVVETNIPNGFTFNAEKSVMNGVVDVSANDQVLIVNTYKPTSADGGAVEVLITKEISGNRTDWLPGEQYGFAVERVDALGNVELLLYAANIPGYGNSNTAGTHLFGEAYDRAGTYYYRVTENVGNQGGITYDTAERRFSVQVADSDMDGDLEIVAVNNEALVTVSGNWLVTANFNNVYAPTGSATAVVNIEKTVNGGHSRAGFQFALYDKNPVTDSDANEIIRSGLTNAAGKASISLTYAANRATVAGTTYTYYLAEIKGNNPNITYDTTVYEATVTVKDNKDGTISATAEIAGTNAGAAAEFTNVYTPSASDFITFSGKKVISTGNRFLNANEFEFVLEGVGTAPMPAVTTAKNAADGSFFFGEIEFTAVGEYTYRIYEKDTDKIGGFTYDKSVYTVVVKVTDNGDATLTADIISITRDSSAATDIIFENAYDPTDATVQLSGTKQLTGKIIRDGEFEFEITAVTAGAPMPAAGIVKNIGGAFSFGTITYTEAGEYVYTVTEVDLGKKNYTYDKSVYTVTVTVTDNSEGLLTATYTIAKDNMSSVEIYFVNGYAPEAKTYDIYAEFGGEKTLVGRTLRDGEFEFKLINAITGKQVGETVKNDAAGKIQFPALTFTSVGTYHYKISEVLGDENGISYDPVVYHVVIGVAQIDDANSSEDGNLTIVRNELHEAHIVIDTSSGTPVETVEYVNVTANGSIAFENTYKATPAEIKLGGKKVLAGRALEEGEFTFNLHFAVLNSETGKWEKGALVEQTTNDADGNFEFATRISDENAEYIYFITEDATDPDPTITYDTKEYMVKVTSTDNLDGTRSLSYEYSIGDTAADEVVFTNTYTAPPPTPDTGDDGNAQRDLWMLMAVAFISLMGITVAGLNLFKKADEK